MSVFYNLWKDLSKRVLCKFCRQSLQFFVHIGTLYIRKTMFLLIKEKSNRSLNRFFYVQGYSLVLWYRKFAANHERMLTPKILQGNESSKLSWASIFANKCIPLKKFSKHYKLRSLTGFDKCNYIKRAVWWWI